MIIKSRNIDGIEKIHIHSESIVMLDWLDELEFTINNTAHFESEWKVVFAFSQEGEENNTSGTIDGRNFRIVLHRWNATPYVDAAKPMEITVDKKKIFIRWRVHTNDIGSARVFNISIWIENV